MTELIHAEESGLIDLSGLTFREARKVTKKDVSHAKTALRIAHNAGKAEEIAKCEERLRAARRAREPYIHPGSIR
ncbi:MAG: hypothetical protein QF747_01935 [Patescibacteria group bacterium]|nr:hypothetical protein [Patescibacteria group bacterium]MDP6756094.1 hypothetical protein [Patescibacteria group bacterium]